MWSFRIAVLALIFAGALPHYAAAHATPISYAPVAGSTELTPPASIAVRFTERVEPRASSLTVLDPEGEEIQQGEGEIGGADGRTFSIPIADGGEGVYTVLWQVVSIDDGHFTKGSYSFLVDSTGKEFEGNAGGIEVTYETSISEGALNFFGLLGESVYLALVVLLACVFKPLMRRGRIVQDEWDCIRNRYKHLLNLGFAVLFFGTLGVVFQKVRELAELQNVPFTESALTFFTSSGGTNTALKLLAAAFFLGIFQAKRKQIFAAQRITIYEWVAFALVFAILYFQSNVSHAAASFFYPTLSVFVTVLHLFAKELIIGGAVVLLCLLPLFVRKSGLGVFHSFLPRYDVLAAGGLLVAGVSGAYVTWLHLKGFENLFDTEWGTRFVLLLLFTGALGVLRLFHQFLVHPHFALRQNLQKRYLITFPVEVTIGLVVLFLSGYISITTPPFTIEQHTFSEARESEGVQVILEAHPYEKDSFRLLLTDIQTNEPPEEVQNVIVTASNRERGITQNFLSVEDRFPGGYAFSRQNLSPPGDWDLAVIVQRGNGYDARAHYDIAYPDDVLATKRTDETRDFDGFAVAMIVAAAAVLVISIILYLHARRQVRMVDKLRSGKRAVLDHSVPSKTAPVLLAAGVIVIVLMAYHVAVTSDFKTACVADGNEWRQAYPTRDFELVSPNTHNGCSVHDGHYHFVDEREYRAFMERL